MEKHPIRDRFNGVKEKLGSSVMGAMEAVDDALFEIPDADPIQDTQPFDVDALNALLEEDESHLIRGLE